MVPGSAGTYPYRYPYAGASEGGLQYGTFGTTVLSFSVLFFPAGERHREGAIRCRLPRLPPLHRAAPAQAPTVEHVEGSRLTTRG